MVTGDLPAKCRNWHRVLIPVNYANISKTALNQQFDVFSEWLITNIKLGNWIYPTTQVNGYWTFFLKRKEDSVLFSLTFADFCEKI